MAVEEKSDEEMAAELVEGAVLLALLTPAEWRIVLANDARGELCDVAGPCDPGQMQAFLVSLGVVLGG